MKIYMRFFFSEFTNYIKTHEYTESSIIPYISADEAELLLQKVLNDLEISEENIEDSSLERYWKWESDYVASLCCKLCDYPDMEKLLRIADVWERIGSNSIMSSWNMPDNTMRYKLMFVDITKA